MLRASLLVGLALSCPLLARLGIEPVLERGERAGAVLGRLTRSHERPPAELPPPSVEEQVVPLDGQELEAAFGGETKAGPKGKKTKRTAAAALPTPKQGIRVRKPSVLRLARAQAIPASHFTPATAQRPSGLQLSGVGGLGIGMQDGDVLTHVAGVPVSDRGQVVNLVLQARAHRASQLSARFYRGEEPWMLVVDLPYPEPKAAPPEAP